MKSVTNFEISSDSDFYIVAENSITGYRLDNVNPIKTVGSEVEVVKGNQNPVVERAELQNRYLVFTDDDWPLSRNEGIISIDFQKGTILFTKLDIMLILLLELQLSTISLALQVESRLCLFIRLI